MVQRDGRKPRILLLCFEPSLHHMFKEILNLEGYATTDVRTAAEALGICEREGERFLVLMDNYHVNEQAITFAKTVFAQPELHARVKVVGISAYRWEDQVDLDAYVSLPFTVDTLLDPINRLGAELQRQDEL